MDSVASKHITLSLSKLSDVIKVQNSPKMKLSTGANTQITHNGNLKLTADPSITDVLCVPKFDFITVQKLVRNEIVKLNSFLEGV